MCYKNIAGRFFALITKQTDRQTYRQTDRQNYESQDRASIPASRGKNCMFCYHRLTALRFSVSAVRFRRWFGVEVTALGVPTKLLYTAGPLNTGMGDRLWTERPPRYIQYNQPPKPTQHPTVSGRKMGSGQSAVTLCGWGVKAGLAHSTCRCTCG